MSTVTAVAVAARPRVNLMPPEIDEERRFRRLRVGLAAVMLAGAGVVAGLYLDASAGVTAAEDQLAVTQSRNATLSHEAAKFADVPVVFGQVEESRVQLATAMATDVRWSYYLNDLSLSIPDKVWLTSMSVAKAAPATQTADPTVDPTAAPQPADAPAVYTISFTGKAFAHNDVADWLDSLAAQDGYANPYVTSSELEVENGRKSVSFASTVDVTEQALSRRYTEKAGS